MVDLLEQLFSVIWQEEIVPRQWRDGLIVNESPSVPSGTVDIHVLYIHIL